MNCTILHRWAAVFLLIAISSCSKLSFITGRSPYEKYKNDIQQSGLSQTALGKDWIRAGTEVFADTNGQVTLPFKGAYYFNPSHPRATLSVFKAKRGQRITIIKNQVAADSFIVFVDLFEADDTSKPVIFMQKGEDTLEYKVKHDRQYLLRLQPELLRGGKVIINILLQPQLSFPVQGASNRNIQSFFGASRDAGARQHEGIDIFASAGTPVLAPAAGRIIGVNHNNLGGKVITQWDTKRNITYYFAHLSQQIAYTGQAVSTGDTIGLVGNTGNAATTPPHLHFGIYAIGGAIDPLSFIYQTDTIPPTLKINEKQLGKWALYKKGKNDFPVKLIGGSNGSYFMLLPDDKKMFADKRYIEPVTTLRTLKLTKPVEVTQNPKVTSTPIAALEKDQQLDVLGSYHDFLLVRSNGDIQGWIEGQ